MVANQVVKLKFNIGIELNSEDKMSSLLYSRFFLNYIPEFILILV